MLLWLLLFIATTILFCLLYIFKQMQYIRLLKKNIEKNISPAELVESTKFPALDFTQKSSEQELVSHLKKAFEEEKVYLQKGLTLNDLAKHVGTNRTTLSKIINVQLGKSFPVLLQDYRVREAMRLLKSTPADQLKIDCVAEQCGFSNPQAFYATFKNKVGVTPNRFKQMCHSQVK